MIHSNFRLLNKYISKANRQNAGRKYNEKLCTQINGAISHNIDSTIIPVNTKYSTRSITTPKISSADELLNVCTISRFNSFKKTVTGHSKLRTLSPGVRLDACKAPFSFILFAAATPLHQRF